MTSDNIAIKVENVSKTFKLPHEKNTSIKSAVINFYKRKKSFETQQVLKNISFEVREGEFFGIVGRNGSGKSTLLKLLAGIYYYDKGGIHINGKLTPFIELGVGFNQELTGRENVYLNGALLGFDRREMDDLYDDIVDFAEIGRFMDQKLKNYSSGMQVRLAFSIAIRVKTDILLIDEVLAVGDANFQRKCIDVFLDMKKQGKTVIFISHDMGAVRRFCDRAIMIHDGVIVDEGSPDEMASRYEVANIDKKQTVETINETIQKNTNKVITEIQLFNGKLKTNKFLVGEIVTVKLKLNSIKLARNVGIAVYTAEGGYVFGTNTILDNFTITKNVSYSFKADLGRGEYQLKLGIFGAKDNEVYEFFDNGPSFIIENKQLQNWEGVNFLEHTWGEN